MKATHLCPFVFLALILAQPASAQLPQAPETLPPDDRYKADILVIVAHPDDDTEITPYLAKAVFDQHKRVAVIYGTRGDAGGNVVGMEQGLALGDVREMEGRHALAALGITNVWFLRGPDTPGQDVLHSLETWHHGASLESIVRLVRLTRPEVILTMLPASVVGENHDDHQAAAVLATEAFDVTADPLTFAEQISPPRKHDGINNYGEGLHLWQAKKIYFFDADGHHVFDGRGPQYSATDVSPSKGIAYSQFRDEAWSYYATQNDLTPLQLKELAIAPVRFIFGKSLVKSSITGDIFEGLPSAAIPYVRPSGRTTPTRKGISIELGGPWAFYHDFWPAHDLRVLESLVKPEAGIGPGGTLWVPLLIHNDTPVTKQVTLRSVLPTGWVKGEDQLYGVEPYNTYPVQLSLTAPKEIKPVWQELAWSAEADGKEIDEVRLNVYVGQPNGLPQ